MKQLLVTGTATGTGSRFTGESFGTYQVSVTGTGAVSSTVAIEVSNDGVAWMTLATVTATGTGTATDGFAAAAAWENCRANVTAISGTGAAVTVTAA